MMFDYPAMIGALNDEQKIRFYELLAFNLTISVRTIWSDQSLTDGQKVEAMKWINEVMHRVVMKSALLRLRRNEHSETETWEIIQHWASIYPFVRGHIGAAIKTSYEAVS